MSRFILLFTLALPLTIYAATPPKQAEVKVQKTSLSRDQEVQLGKESAIQVEREKEVVHNVEIEHWLNQIGQNLGKTPQANAYPYYFKLVNDDSINAFALPGGPMYVHTGLLKAADSEGEVAGVLAHEMSHIALRHRADGQATDVGHAVRDSGGSGRSVHHGQNGPCGMLCQITQAGTSLWARIPC